MAEQAQANVAPVPEARLHSHFQRHNFGQQRHRIENKLKLRSLYKGIDEGNVRHVDPFDFKNEFRQMADGKLNKKVDFKIGKADLLGTVKESLKNQKVAMQGQLPNYPEDHKNSRITQSNPVSQRRQNTIGNTAERGSTLMRKTQHIMNAQGSTLAHGGNAHYMLNHNNRAFSKRIYTIDDKHTHESQAYMRSSIDLSFDGGNYFGIRKEIKENDLRDILASSETKGKFQAPKDMLKIQNNPRGSQDLQTSFYDQQKAQTGVRRFIEPSEGDSIFNYDKDIRKKTKMRMSHSSLPHQNVSMDADTMEVLKRSSNMSQMLQKYKSRPEEVIQDAKRMDYVRMHKQSAYTNTSGYKCHAIQAQMKNVSRKRAILDHHHDPLNDKTTYGQFPIQEDQSLRSQSVSSLRGIVELHRRPKVTKQSTQPAQNSTNYKSYHSLPMKQKNFPQRARGSTQTLLKASNAHSSTNIQANKDALQEIKLNYLRQKQEAERVEASKLYQPTIEDMNIKVPHLYL